MPLYNPSTGGGGAVSFATGAEVDAGTVNDKAVTPLAIAESGIPAPPIDPSDVTGFEYEADGLLLIGNVADDGELSGTKLRVDWDGTAEIDLYAKDLPPVDEVEQYENAARVLVRGANTNPRVEISTKYDDGPEITHFKAVANGQETIIGDADDGGSGTNLTVDAGSWAVSLVAKDDPDTPTVRAEVVADAGNEQAYVLTKKEAGSSYQNFIAAGEVTKIGDAGADDNGTRIEIDDLLETIKIFNLPTANPAVANQLWNDAGALKISAG